MAMGADRAIHVEIEAKEFDQVQPLHIAKILAKIAQEEKTDIVLVGKQVHSVHLMNHVTHIGFQFVLHSASFFELVFHCRLIMLLHVFLKQVFSHAPVSCHM